MREQQIQRIKGRLRDIDGVTDGDQSGDRNRLATVYEMTLQPPSYFPPLPLEFKGVHARTLRRKVCSYCPSAIRPAQMKRHVENCKGQLRRYAALLRGWLKERNALTEPEQEASTSIHDLNSTL